MQQTSNKTVPIETQAVDESHKDNLHESHEEKLHDSTEVQADLIHGSIEKSPINHQKMGQYANSTLQIQSNTELGIKISIIETATKSNFISKYTAYRIKGQDKNGQIDVFRRFNQFHEMRALMIKRWPGVFIPSIPDKNLFNKNQQDLIQKRYRYLNDFLQKMKLIDYLYYSEEFQALVRSKEVDLSKTFEKWGDVTSEAIINIYSQRFSYLAGKQINQSIKDKINDLQKVILKHVNQFQKYRHMVKSLALERDRLDAKYPELLTISLPAYERECLSFCVDEDEQKLICLNSENAKFIEHEAIVKQSITKNPYWLLYDLMRQEERDGKAFLQMITAIERYEQKRGETEIKITQNLKHIAEIQYSKKPNEELKFKLEVDTETLKKEKGYLITLIDIIIAKIGYDEVDKYRAQRAAFYRNTLKKIGGYQINFVQNIGEIWNDWLKSTKKSRAKYA